MWKRKPLFPKADCSFFHNNTTNSLRAWGPKVINGTETGKYEEQVTLI